MPLTLAARESQADMAYQNYPVSVTDTMYKDPRVRKAIDECAFRYVVYNIFRAFRSRPCF